MHVHQPNPAARQFRDRWLASHQHLEVRVHRGHIAKPEIGLGPREAAMSSWAATAACSAATATPAGNAADSQEPAAAAMGPRGMPAGAMKLETITSCSMAEIFHLYVFPPQIGATTRVKGALMHGHLAAIPKPN